MQTLDSSKPSKWDECKDCIYFQEIEQELLDKNNSSYDTVIDMYEFVKNCNLCKEVTRC